MAKTTTKAIAWLPSAAAGTSITPSGSAWTNTSPWTQFSASTAGVTQIVAVTYTPGVAADFEIEFGTGGAGSEVGIGSVHARALGLISTGGDYGIYLGAIIDKVANATRLSMRLRTDSTDVTAWKFAIGYMIAGDSTDLSDQIQIVTPGAQNLSATVSSGGTWTNGSYLQTTTGISTDQLLTSLSISSGGTTEEYEIDIGVGSGGNEVVVTTIRANVRGNNGTGHYVMPNPVFLQGNTRIATRVRAASGSFNTFIALNTTPAMYLNISVSDSSAVTESKTVEEIFLVSKNDSSAVTESVTMSWPLAETFQENFNFGGIDSGKWTSSGGGVVMGTNLDLEITTNNDYESISSLALYNLTGSYMYSQVTDAGNQALASFEVYPVYLIADANNKLFIRITGNVVQPIKVVANVTTNIGTGVAYNSTTMKYFRISESGGTTHFSYASDPTSTWTDITTASNPITVTALTLEILVGTWNLQNSTAKLDNVNTYPTQYQLSWKGFTWNQRIHQGSPSNNQWWAPANVSGPDGNGYLTFTLSNPLATPYGGEMFSDTRGWGYGIYTSVIGTELDTMNHKIGFGGLFTFDFTAPPDYKEIDSSEVRDYNSNTNIRILHSHVYNNAGSGTFITDDKDIDPSAVQTHQLIWTPNSLTFNAYTGTGTGGTLYFQTVQTTNLPTPGLERVHFNIWNNTGVTGYKTVAPFSVVVRDFTFAVLLQITPNDSSAVTDVATVEIVDLVNANDASTVTDVVTRVMEIYNINVNDASAVTDVVTQVMEIYFMSVNDASAVTESVTLEKVLLIEPTMVDQQQLVETGPDAVIFDFGQTTANQKQAQSFKPAITARIAQVLTAFIINGSPVDAIQLQVYSDSAGNPGSLLATSDNTIAAGGNRTFTFTNGPSLTSGTTYWLLLSRTGSLDDTNYYSVGGTDATTDYYTNGQLLSFNGSTWVKNDSSVGFFCDAFFQESYTSAVEFSTVTDVLSQVLKIDFVNVNDTSAVTESVTVLIPMIPENVNDASAVTDAPTVEAIDLVSVNDASAVTDVITVRLVNLVNVNDTSAVTDVVTQVMEIYFMSVNDASAVTDVPTVELINLVNVNDASAVTESVVVSIPVVLSVSDSSTVTDVLTQVLEIYFLSVSDASAVTDIVSQVLEIYFLSISDSSAVTESIVVSIPVTFSVNDSSTVTDVVSQVLEIDNVNVSDSSAATESVTLLLPYGQASVNDSSAVTESVIVELINLVNVSDSSATTDVVSQVLEIYNVNVSDSSTVTDVITQVLEIYNINVNDSSAITDVVSQMLEIYFVNVNESSIVTESVTVSLPSPGGDNVNVSDSSAVTDVPTVELITFINVNDSSAVTESTTEEEVYLITVSEGYPYNLLSYYSFNENTGTAVGDSAGSSNGTWHGTLGSQWTPGMSGSGGNFNGSDNYVQSTITSGLNGSFTIAAWINPVLVGLSPTQTIAMLLATSYSNYWFDLTVGSDGSKNGVTIGLYDGVNNPFVQGATTIITNTWNHAVMVRDTNANKIILYVNGVNDGSATDTTTSVPPYQNFLMGLDPGRTNNDKFKGIIDEAAVFPRALSASEISGLFNNGRGAPFIGQYLNVTDTTVVTTPVAISVNDASAVTDVVTQILEIGNINVNDASAVTESVSVVIPTYYLNVSDASGVTENTTVEEVYTLTVNDSSAVTDVPIVMLVGIVSIFEYAPALDARQNRVTNPSFETNTTGWSLAGTHSRSNDRGMFGSWAIKFFNASAGVNQASSTNPGINVASGGTYTFSAYMYVVSGYVGNSSIDILEFDSKGVQVLDGPNIFSSLTDQWERLSVTQTMNSRTTSVKLRFVTDGSAVGTAYFDGAMFESGSAATTYIDGTQTNCSWDGAANASTSSCSDVTVISQITDFSNVNDTSTVTDIPTVEIIDLLSVSDASTIADVVIQIFETYNINVSDSSTVTDVVSQVLEIYFINVEEDSAATDSVTVTIVTAISVINVSDSSAVTDVVSQVLKINFINVFDSSTVTSVLTGQNGGIYLNPLDIFVVEIIGPYFLIFVDGRPAIRLFNNFYTFI